MYFLSFIKYLLFFIINRLHIDCPKTFFFIQINFEKIFFAIFPILIGLLDKLIILIFFFLKY